MPIKLTDLVARVPAEVERRVRRSVDQARPAVQDALRAECRLVLRTPDETEHRRPGAQVPIEVEAGYPLVLEPMVFSEDYERIMLLGRYRGLLEQARNGTSGLLELRKELLARAEPDNWVSAGEADLRNVANWAAALLGALDKHDPLKSVLSVSEDFLGVYEYDPGDLLADERTVNRATIRLYWGVIGLVSEWLGCAVEDLTVVALTHELAHAYTQLGADIEGRRWPVRHFGKAERALKEGLAQYYTDRVLRRLQRRHAGALKVFLALLPGQSEVYRAHEAWITSSSPEAVRRAMLEVRRWNEGRLDEFVQRLENAKKDFSLNAAST